LREDPVDAEVASHKLLVRAGYIRRAAPGVYTWLPLGLRVLRKVENVVREEMNAIGAQEVLFPALLPREPYEATNRWEEYGDNLFRLQDRKGADMLLAPTHEEMFTLLVKDLYSSYKDLPVYLYQIQTKYRDEARPRAGLLRGREFVMKDSYSLDIEDAVHGALEGAGFVHYETSAFAKPAMQCRHNLNYWQFGDYLGIGAGAHGKISYPDRIERTVRRRHPNDYLALMQSQPSEAVERKTVAAEDLPFEFMMNALRLTDGVPAAMLQERTGIPAAKIMAQIETARQKGLLETDPTVFRPTEQGRLFLNDLLQCFL